MRRICIISDARNPHILRWTKALVETGIDVTVITSDPVKEPIPGVNIIECRLFKEATYFKKIANEILRSFRINNILKNLKPDVVHLHSIDYIHPLMIAIISFFSDSFSHMIVSTWGTDVIGNYGATQSWRGTISKRLLLRRAKEVTATSSFLANATTALCQKGKKVHVIPFGVDCELFAGKGANYTAEKDMVTIGFVKHLYPKYGPEYLIMAMALIVKEFPNSRLIMVGRGAMEKQLKQLVVYLGIEDKVFFKGLVPYDHIPEVLKEIDVFAMPSVHDSETFGVSAIEAQAMEIPVVATKVGGVSEILIDGETGFLIEPGNTEKLYEAIKKLIVDPVLRKRFGLNGRENVLKKFNIKDNVKDFETLYNKICLENPNRQNISDFG